MEHTSEETPKKHRRRWLPAEKEAILREAEISSVSAVAKRHQINPALLFQWRSGSKGSDAKAVREERQSENIQFSLSIINTLMKVAGAASKQLLSESESKRKPSYNTSCTLTNIANAVSKLGTQQLEFSDRLKVAIASELREKQSKSPEKEFEVEMEREAEKVLLHLVKNHLIPKQKLQQEGEQAAAY